MEPSKIMHSSSSSRSRRQMAEAPSPAPGGSHIPPTPTPPPSPPPVVPSSSPPPPTPTESTSSPPPPTNVPTAPAPPGGTPASTPPPPPSTISTTPPAPNTPNAQGPSPSTIVTIGGSVHAGLVAGVVVGVVVFLALAVALVVFLVRRRRKDEEGGGGTAEETLENQREGPEFRTSNTNGRVDGSTNPREEIKLPTMEAPKATSSHEMPYILDYHLRPSLYSGTSTSSSLSTRDNAQSPIASLGLKPFTYEELSHATNQFSNDKYLGRGGFGSVYHGVITNTGDGNTNVAIKVLKDGSFQGEREFLTEINVISRVHHRNLVSLVGYCVNGSGRLLVYEYLENNNLAFHLSGSARPVLDWKTRMRIALGAAKGIAYLHEECQPRIIHRDIKSPNILLDSNFGAKVADFGLAKFVLDNQTHVTTRVIGTLGYIAPEFGSSGRLTEKSDVFSFGVVLLELITGRPALNLVEWGSPLLEQSLEDAKFASELIDPRLEVNYDHEEMNKMITCAAISVHRFPDNRPRMSQVVHVLEGNISLEKLKADLIKSRIRHPSA